MGEVQRTKAGKFAPGTSGNPAGRPKQATTELKRQLAERGPEIVETAGTGWPNNLPRSARTMTRPEAGFYLHQWNTDETLREHKRHKGEAMQRITKASAEGLRQADRVALVPLADGWGLKWYAGERFGFAHGGESIMVYPDQRAARRVVRRYCPGLEPVVEVSA